MYNPSETTTTSVNYFEPEDFEKASWLSVAALVSLGAHLITFMGIEADYKLDNAHYLARDAELKSLAPYMEDQD